MFGLTRRTGGGSTALHETQAAGLSTESSVTVLPVGKQKIALGLFHAG